MSHARPDDERILRRILLAAADQVEPRADGLERIQHRLGRPRPAVVAWAMVAWTRLSLRASSGLGYLADRVVTECRLATERFLPQASGGPTRLRWLRPLAAMGTAVAIIGVVVYMAAGFSQVIAPSSSETGSTGSASHNAGGNPSAGSGHALGTSGTQPGSSTGPSGGTRSGPNCASPGASTAPATIQPPPGESTSPTSTGSPSPSSTPSPTPTGTPTPTPTPSSSSSTGTTNPGSGSSSSPTTDGASIAKSRDAGTSKTISTVALTRGDATSNPTVSASCPTKKPAKKGKSHSMSPDAAGPFTAPALTANPGKLG
jgi:hypothetical protein